MGGMKKMDYIYKINQTVSFLKKYMKNSPKIAVVLGSGLGGFENIIENKTEIFYKDIPNFPVSTVEGHIGKLIFGTVYGCDILAMCGRFHYYEGYKMQEIAFPVRVFKMLGIENLILSAAVGGINESYKPGDFMLISDHIKFFDDSPLRGKNYEEFGPRFNDMSSVYAKGLRNIAKNVANLLNIEIKEGVYGFMPGPSFETPAEIKMLRILGADAVGMSTVPEAITACHTSLNVLGIACITNMAAGILSMPLSHIEVMEIGKSVEGKFSKFVCEIIKKISEEKNI